GSKLLYVGGHLFACRFNGTGHAINIVPMLQSINMKGGSWYAIEEYCAILLKHRHDHVIMEINLKYDSNASVVPSTLDVIVSSASQSCRRMTRKRFSIANV
ncbi:MAG TPA: DNA/RNA non-specific endonuclease, partial [Oculatellaceae cyanobacterium]